MYYLWLLIPLIHTAGLFFAWQALYQQRSVQGTLAWLLGLIFLPYIAVPAFLYFGEQKFSGYVRARRSGDSRLSQYADQLADNIEPYNLQLDASHPCKPLENLSRRNFSSHNNCSLLINGEATFTAIAAAIADAQHYVLVQFYIVSDDALGQKIRQDLIRAQQRGISIYFLFDEIGCHDLDGDFWQPLIKAGASIHPFNSTRGRNKFQLNFRNHRKICIVDGTQGFVGGHNLSETYLHLRDTHLSICGPAVLYLQLFFLEDWYWATGTTPKLNWQIPPAITGNAQVLPVALAPTHDFSTGSLLFTQLIQSARQKIWLVSPYFVPDESICTALHLAALRGVEVRILLPEKSDLRFVDYAAWTYIEQLQPQGVEFYLYNAGQLHEKVCLIDEHLSAIGTANLDNRSLHINFEVVMLIEDEALAHQTAAMLSQDFANSQKITADQIQRRSRRAGFFSRIMRLFAPLQ